MSTEQAPTFELPDPRPRPPLRSARALGDFCIWRELTPVDGATRWELVIANRVLDSLMVQRNEGELWYVPHRLDECAEDSVPHAAPRAFELDWIRSGQTARYRFVFPIKNFRWQPVLTFHGATTELAFKVAGPLLEAGPRGEVLPVEYEIREYSDRPYLPGFDVRIWHRGGEPASFPIQGDRVFDREEWVDLGVAPRWGSEHPGADGRLYWVICALIGPDAAIVRAPIEAVLQRGVEMREIVGRPDDCLPVFLGVDLQGSKKLDPSVLRLYLPRGSCNPVFPCWSCGMMDGYGVQ